MSNTKISALTGATTPLAGTEVLPIVQSSATKQVSVANLTAGRSVNMADATLSTGNVSVNTANKGVVGNGGSFLQLSTVISAGATTDLVIDIAGYGFAGILCVSTTRYNYNPQSTRTVFAITAYGTTMTNTSLHTQNGSGGGMAFTITCPTAGVVRFTDTSGSGSQVVVYLTYSGALNFAYA
jgi:hypothetical protein